ncbi:hypothetical protein RO3G_00385 [Rhizopus delemar RA 99-880]|uniref:Uncharacterized protein n=3 Tax=Rhizopus TaxID=4842 RepID=I1BHK1_RHIO9|nr:hypothetical protein RO3G_00385 [Rhizopus delemar RA 99-880]|eukprot:EIE75681.1 hypothetical protein RO3G_00385 [Rhizopus delemar RA 99-880]
MTVLKEIEHLAEGSLTKAYREFLMKQAEYAFTKEETYFKIYAHVISVMKLHPEYLEAQRQYTTEANTCIQIWSPIIDSIFELPTLKIMWGDSINGQSSIAKKANQESNKKCIGDKIDFRVCCKDRNKLVDLLNGEIAKDQTNNKKYFDDHAKLCRESKIISDQFYSSPHVKNKEKKTLKVRGIQLCGIEGEIIETRLVEEGLYTFSVLGSLRLPIPEDHLYRLRTLIERLFEIKRGCLALARIYRKMKEARKDFEKNMAKNRNTRRSPGSNSDVEDHDAVIKSVKYIGWVRGSWFPPSRSNSKVYDGSLPAFLLSPPLLV